MHRFFALRLSGMIRIGPITLRDNPLRAWPLNSKLQIIPPHAPCTLWMEELRHLIEDFRLVLKCLESMSYTFRNVHHPPIFPRQFSRYPLLERRRGGPQVEHDIIDCSPRTTNELCFFVRDGLIVHPSQSSFFFIEGDAALHKVGIQPIHFEFFLTKRPREKSSFVLDSFQLDDERAFQFRFFKNHPCTVTSGMGTTNFPPHSRIPSI